MKYFLKIMILSLCVLMPCTISAHAGTSGEEVSTSNRITTGDVHIDLQEYAIENGHEQLFQNHQIVLPGDVISKIPRVQNLGEDCYVRMSVNFLGDTILTEEQLQEIQPGWKHIGNYYYYTKILKRGSHIDLFRGLQIPTTLTEASSENIISLNLRAEAIQASGFAPDFSSEQPWGDQTVEDCVHEIDNQLLADSRPVLFTVEYKDDSQKLILQEEDFFQNFQRLMPGTSYTDQASISNSSEQAIELFFRTGYDASQEDAASLLESLKLTIQYNQKTLYQGNLKAEALEEGISLGIFAPGASGEMQYTITVPKELTNSFARRQAEVIWTYSMKEASLSVTPDPTTSVHTGSDTGTASPVKTGDETSVFQWILLLFAGAVLIGIGVFWKRRKQHDA